jgi:hypothetical protein
MARALRPLQPRSCHHNTEPEMGCTAKQRLSAYHKIFSKTLKTRHALLVYIPGV